MTVIRRALLLTAGLAIVAANASAQTWRLVDVQNVEPKRVEGRGGDFITYAPDIKFTPPPTLTIGEAIDITASATYTYGASAGSAGGGRPKSLILTIDVPSGNKSQRYPLVPNTCTGTGTQPPALPESGSVGPLTSSGRLTDADRTTRSFTIAVTVSANIFCFEPEAGGTAGIRATYEQGGPSVNNPPQAEIYVHDPDRIVTPGQQVYLKAKVRDEDPPTKLTYEWTVTDPATGQQRRVVKHGTRVIRMSIGDAPKYRIDLSVTDTGGLKGDAAPVELTTEKASIQEFVVSEESKQEVTVKDYWENGLSAARRGDWVEVTGTLKNYNRDLHCLRLYVDGVRVSNTPGVPPHPDGWRPIEVINDGLNFLITVQVPPDVAVGRHKVELGLNRRKPRASPTCDLEVDRASLTDDLFVLFNGFSAREADVSVNAGKPLSDAAAYVYSVHAWDIAMLAQRSMGVEPADKFTREVAEQVINDLGKALGKGRRADAAAVAEQLTLAAARALEGKWGEPYANAIRLPWEWNSASEIFAEYLRMKSKSKVKYGQCWVYGTIVTALLRSVGIPARMITVEGSVHDSGEPWGVGNVNDDRTGQNYRYEVWNFHVWVEAWIPSANGTSGWVLLDATPQGRAGPGGNDPYVAAPSLAAVAATPHLPLPQQYPDGRDDVFVFTETNLPRADLKLDCEKGKDCGRSGARGTDFMACLNDGGARPPYGTAGGGYLPILECYLGNRAASKGWVMGEDQSVTDHLGSYKVARSIPPVFAGNSPSGLAPRLWDSARALLASLFSPRAAHAQNEGVSVVITAPGAAAVRRPVSISFEFRGLPDDRPSMMAVKLYHLPLSLSGGAEASEPPLVHQERRTITPSGRQFRGTVNIPASALGVSGRYELSVGLNGIAGALGHQRFTVDGPPIVLEAPASVAPGASFDVRAVLTNPLSEAITGVRLQLQLSPGLETSSQVRVEAASLAGKGQLQLRATVRATRTGSQRVWVLADGSAGLSTIDREIIVNGPRQLAVRAFPVTGAAPGAETNVSAEIRHSLRTALAGAEATLTAPEGVEIVGDPRQRTERIAVNGLWRPVWRVRAARAGAFKLKVAASAGDVAGAGSIGLLAGVNNADELPVIVPKDDPPPLDEGEDPNDPSLVPEDIGEDPAEAASGAGAASSSSSSSSSSGGAGGGGGGGGRSMLRMSPSVWLAAGVLGLGIVVLALAIVVVAKRRRDGGE